MGSVEERLAVATAQTADVARQNAREAERFRRMAFEDPLTGLPNRRGFEDRLAELGPASEPSLLILDVDSFKLINDTLGHAAGDAALCRLAGMVRATLWPSDFAARVGGDEFAVLLPDASPYEAVCVADRLRAAVEHDETEPRMTVSIGISRCTGDVRRAALSADAALYEAKRGGRNAVLMAGSE
jgi:diguanylate cyclase (GGDEF)-like protein